MNRKNWKKGKTLWTVKNNRPEEYIIDPKIYYTDEEVENYSKSGGMRRAQEKIAYRILEFLELKKGSKIIDIGSGPGYTAEIYRGAGYNITCLDLIPKMLEKAKEKGFETILADMREIKKTIKRKKFDGAISVSAIQWIKKPEELEKIAIGIYSILKKESPLIIQFYPKTEGELNQTFKAFKENGFEGEIIIDWPKIPKNKTIFLVLKRK